MSLRERFGGWIAGKRGATDPIDFVPAYGQSFGPGIGNQPSHERLLQENLGVADMATRAIANRLSSLNPQVKITRTITGGTQEDEILDDHPLKALLDRPHPNLSRAQLLRLTGQYIVTVGESYWLKVGNGLGLPTELHPVPPGRVFPRVSENVIAGYTVLDANGRRNEIAADEMVRFFFPDPESPWTSEGYLGPNGTTADSLKFSKEHLRAHYQNDATPKVVLKALEGAEGFSEPEKKRFITEWKRQYHSRLGTEQGMPAILPTFYDMVVMTAQSGADIVPLLEYWRDDQLMGMGTPRSILGQVVSGDRSSAETNQYVFDRHTVLPIAMLVSEGITLQLAPDFDATIFCEFEQFVSEDKRFGLEQEVADLVNKVRSPQQILRDRGSDPEDASWGELPVGKIGEMPYDPEGVFELQADVPTALGDSEEEEEEERIRRKSRAAFFTARAEWDRQLAREQKFVPAFQRAVLRVLTEQKKSVLKRLQESEERTRVTAEELFVPEDWAKVFELRVEPIRELAFREIMGETLGGLGVDEFVFTDEMANVIRKQGAQMVRQVNHTTGKRLAEAISKVEAAVIAGEIEIGVAQGESVDQIASSVRRVFNVRRKEARTIARTEILKASQQAQITAFETSGVVERKVWHTSMDAAVRETHMPAEGQLVGLREPFVLGDGEAAMAPGIGVGGDLSAGNSINCRCFVLPVRED